MKQIKEGYKQTKVGIIPEDWEVRKLESISDFITKGATPTTYGFDWQENGIPFLRSECVSEHGLNLKASMFICQDAHNIMKRSAINSGDILMTITGNVGRVVLLENFKEGNINQHIARIRIIEKLANRNFIFSFLSQSTYQTNYFKITTGQAYPQLSLVQVRDSLVSFPPLKEQEKIAEILTTWDNAIIKQQELIKSKEEQKKGLMQKLLSGEVRFDGFSDEWEEVQVSQIFQNIGGTSLESEVTKNGKYKFISIGNYSVDGRYIDNQQRINLNEKTKDKLLYKDNLVMVLNDKTASGDLIGSTILINEDNIYIYNQRSERLICLNKIVPLYAWFKLNSKDFRKKIFSLSQGGTQIYINFPAIKKMKINLPSKEEQQKIAEVLSLADEEINNLKNELKEQKQQKKALMKKLLTGQVRVKI